MGCRLLRGGSGPPDCIAPGCGVMPAVQSEACRQQPTFETAGACESGKAGVEPRKRRVGVPRPTYLGCGRRTDWPGLTDWPRPTGLRAGPAPASRCRPEQAALCAGFLQLSLSHGERKFRRTGNVCGAWLVEARIGALPSVALPSEHREPSNRERCPGAPGCRPAPSHSQRALGSAQCRAPSCLRFREQERNGKRSEIQRAARARTNATFGTVRGLSACMFEKLSLAVDVALLKSRNLKSCQVPVFP